MLIPRVPAYVFSGLWIADCPRRYCNSAERIRFAQRVFECSVRECRQVAELWWHPEAAQIWAELLRRPLPVTRNWAPAGHRQAHAVGCPHGQTVADLRAEFATHDPLAYAVAELQDRGVEHIQLTPAAAQLLYDSSTLALPAGGPILEVIG